MPMGSRDLLPVGQLLRISADRTGQGLGVERQSHDNQGLAEARCWRITETFSDNDKSAYKGRFGPDGKWITGRPEYERCLQWLREGRIKGLVAYHPDRVFGHPRELEDLIDLVDKTGIEIATVQTGSYDLTTAPGRFVARTIAAASRYEREMKAGRHKSKHEQLARDGRPAGGGHRPFGFDEDQITLRSHEADVIQEMARRVAAQEAVRGIATDLNRRAVPTARGKQWTQATIRQIVTSPRVAGLRAHRGEIVSDAVWPAIVDRQTWEAARRVFADPARRTKRSARSYLLVGLVFCGYETCGAKIVSRPTETRKRAYGCVKGPGFAGCGRLRIMADDFERFIVAGLLHRLDGDGLALALARRSATTPSVSAVELTDVERRLEKLAEMYAAGTIDARGWVTAKTGLDERRATLTAALAAQSQTSALSILAGPGGPREQWKAISFDQRHAALRVAVRVKLHPAVKGRNYFDPDRIEPDWLI